MKKPPQKVAVVTGSSGGLGSQLVVALLRDGRNVIGFSRSGFIHVPVKSFETDFSANFINVVGDITNFRDVENIFTTASDAGYHVSSVIHCAGIHGPYGSIITIDSGGWDEAIRVNLSGTFNILKSAARHFEEYGAGHFVGLSGGGATSPMPRVLSYAASKAAVVRLIESVAIDYLESGSTFNSVAPGIMDTKMLDQVISAGPDSVGKDFHARMLSAKKEGTDNTLKAIDLILALSSGKYPRVTGKLISAVWDDWRTLLEDKDFQENPEIFTLRRLI